MIGAVLFAMRNAATHPEIHRKRTVTTDLRDTALEYSYFEILTAACVDMIRSDGRIDADELDFLQDLLGLSRHEAERLITTQGFTHYRRVFTFLTERQKKELLTLLLECAEPGGVNPAEAAFLTRTVEQLGLPEALRARALKRIRTLSRP